MRISARFWIYFEAWPAANAHVACFSSSSTTISTTNGMVLKLRTDGKLDQNGVQSAVLAINTFHLVEMFCIIGTGAADGYGFKVNGTEYQNVTGATVTDTLRTHCLIGPESVAGNNFLIRYDDFKLNDSYGATETGYPNAGELALLVPTADSSVGSGWTKPGGATTNLYTSLDNVPPNGVADSTSAAQAENQIRNATANSTYAAVMQSYAAAGVSGTILGVQAVVAYAAPVTTSAKTGSVGLTSNPASTAVSFGSFFSATAATFPTGWKFGYGTYEPSPTVVLSTAPVLQLNITGGTTTRIAMACFAGIYVEYIPETRYIGADWTARYKGARSEATLYLGGKVLH